MATPASAQGAKVTTPHPIDFRIASQTPVIVEAKIVGRFSPVLAVRYAVGQLFEYRNFIGPKESLLCILLDTDPGNVLVEYVEQLGLLILWLTPQGFFAGPETAARLTSVHLTFR
jgi:hypothetical protein